MHGLMFTIDRLGEQLAAAEQALAQAHEENRVLREQLEAATAPPDSEPRSPSD